eukprot:Transcript_32337.p1 GENE.Transcript_32337~~Transcript_32337.p1  ORF type:complete len:304 (+),score=74.66 Transcript_32337:140-1051(+)
MILWTAVLLASGLREGVLNLRPVSPSLPGLYRSAAYERATAADAAEILDGLRIRTVIDLRNNDEIHRAQATATPYGRALFAAYRDGAPVGPGQLASEGTGRLHRVHLPLLGDTDAFWTEVATRLPPARNAQALLYRSVDGRRYDRLLCDELARQGHELLYTAMLRSTSADAWGRALSLAADRSSGGVLIHCSKGKDRTGVLAALLQHAAGDSEQQIVSDYAASAALLGEEAAPRARGWRRAKVVESDDGAPKVDWSALNGSPAQAMAGTLAWVRREYGALDNFLEGAGAGDTWRRTLGSPSRW